MATDTPTAHNLSSPKPPVEDVKFEDALAEGSQPTAVETEQPAEDVVDILTPKSKVVEWKIGQGEYERVYVQRELSFIGKMQWFSLVGEVLDKAMSGEGSLRLGNLLSAPGSRGGALSMDDFRDADTFVQAVGKLVSYAPDFLEKSFCIWLNVPDYERDFARQVFALPAEEGGLSDKQGIEIIETFIDQNYGALDSFFREKIGGLRKRVEARQKDTKKSSESPLSKR